MLRSKLLLFILSGALIFASCSDSGTGSGNGDGDGDGNGNGNGEETVEPTASVNNPSDGAMLEGEITFSVEGESEDGFDELRVYVGEEQVETVDSPSLPYEYALATYEYNNGDHDLTAELDPSDQDTTVEASVSATFENYLVEIDTEGYIEYYIKEYDNYTLFISDPDGNVLRSVNLEGRVGDEVKLLPPSAFENGAPNQFAMTQFYTFGSSSSFKYNFIDTWVGFESWTTRLAGESFYSSSSPSEKELTVEMGNFDKPYDRGTISFDEGSNDYLYPSEDTLQTTVDYDAQSDQLFAIMKPYDTASNNTPVFKWEQNIGNLSDPDTLRYDLTNDFTDMVSTNISHPSGLALNYYRYDMSISPDTWDDGSFWSGYFRGSGFDTNSSETELGMFIPKKDHLYDPAISLQDENNEDVGYYQYTSSMPNEFEAVDGQFSISNRSFDNMQFEATGSADYLELNLTDIDWSSHYHLWWVFLPKDTESFVLPNISDSLDSSVQNYSRSDFNLSWAYLNDDSDYESYSDYLSALFGSLESENEAYRYKFIDISNTQSKSIRKVSKDRQNQLRDFPEIPIQLQRKKFRGHRR